MNKKIITVLLIVTIIIQLSVTTAFTVNKTITEKKLDESEKIITLSIDITSGYNDNDNVINFYFNDLICGYHLNYYIIEEEKDGYNKLTGSETLPKGRDYIKASAFQSNTVSSYNCEKFDYDYLCYVKGIKLYDHTSTAKYKVYKGEIKLIDVYVDGVQIDEWYERIIEN